MTSSRRPPVDEPMPDPAVGAALDELKRKLLDLSRRNRLLNYRPTKASTVIVVDELPSEVFRILWAEEKAMHFLADAGASRSGEEADSLDVDDRALDGVEYVANAPAAGQHQDTFLQTRLDSARLDHVLRRIADQARQVEEDTGVSTMFLALGMLNYFESDDSDEPQRAPIILLPVTLTRASARSPWAIRARDDDPVLNASLEEYLRGSFGVTLPALPEEADRLDLAAYLAEVATLVQFRSRWRITNDIALGLFSFQKFVMYKDMEKNRVAYIGHPIFRRIVSRSGTVDVGLPDEVRRMSLDEEFAPESTPQVVDADSSQLRAMAAVSRAHDLVIQGPPGTGKSQTITNLIAGAVAAGKSVLFVAEKMAALQVVHRRLQDAGLGDFCLETHSAKGNKRAVVAELRRALDASLEPERLQSKNGARLAEVRGMLTAYTRAVHGRISPLDMTPFEAIGRRASVDGAPRLELRVDVTQVTREQFDAALRALGEVSEAAEACTDVTDHPWRGARRSFLPERDQAAVHKLVANLRRELRRLVREIATTQPRFGLPPATRLRDASRALALAGLLDRAPGAETAVLESPTWNNPPPLAIELLKRGRRATELAGAARDRFASDALTVRHGADIAVVHRLHHRWHRMFVREYRAVRRRWLQMRRPDYRATLGEQAEHLREVDAYQTERAWLGEVDREAKALFGRHWLGFESNWSTLESYINWVVDFRAACVQLRLQEQAMVMASQGPADVAELRGVAEHAEASEAHRNELGALLCWPDGYLADLEFDDFLNRLDAMGAAPQRFAEWANYLVAREASSGTVAAEVLDHLEAGEVQSVDLLDAFERTFLQSWLDHVVATRPELRNFHGLTHDQRIREFQSLDAQVLLENRRAIAAGVRARTQDRLTGLAATPAMALLRDQITRQRGHLPLRTIFAKAGEPIRAIKPCFMMSPLTVAQYLDPALHSFDLVIFDEASQVTPEDAVGSVVRGGQLVVVGDQRQLPPTNFFAVQGGQQAAEVGADGQLVVDDRESILELCLAGGIRQTMLAWHYRSRHESLIAFSNANFYESKLLTFPSADTDQSERGLQFEFVPDGVYEGAGLNRVEARRVADAVVEHFRADSGLSLAVGTFNLRQQLAIQDELEQRRRQYPDLEKCFAPGPDGFFVRNLENIQGDERDVIFLSVTYARGPFGGLNHNFGPINGDNGWRRLNVLVTRARHRLRVFSSMRADDIDLRRTKARGARLLQEFLRFAETGQLTSAIVAARSEVESPFEREVFEELTRRGLEVVPQVGVAGYRIDLGVLDSASPGRFICGLECDGVLYHSSETARDRDRLRQQVLERLGWRIVRLWSTDWFKDREAETERLLRRIDEAKRAAPTSPRLGVDKPVPDPSPPSSNGSPVSAPPPEEGDPGEKYTRITGWKEVGQEGLLAAPFPELLGAVVEVVRVEGPVHASIVAQRVIMKWGDRRAGSRIQARIESALAKSVRSGQIERRGDFYFWPSRPVVPRFRSDSGISPEHIAPEEYEAAVLKALVPGPLQVAELVRFVRSILGFDRTGNRIQPRIEAAIERLRTSGKVGEGGSGLQLRD